MHRMVARYQKALKEPALDIGAHAGEEEAIASVRMTGGGQGQHIGLELRQTIGLTLQHILTAEDLITVDEELARRHKDLFVRALNFLIPHELGHVLLRKQRGERYAVSTIDFDAAPFAGLADEGTIQYIADEVRVDRLAFDLGAKVYQHAEGLSTESSLAERAAIGLRDSVIIVLDNWQTERGHEHIWPIRVLHAARFEAELRELSGNAEIGGSLPGELRQLAEQVHARAIKLEDDLQNQARYNDLVEAYRHLFLSTQIDFKGLLKRKGPGSSKDAPTQPAAKSDGQTRKFLGIVLALIGGYLSMDLLLRWTAFAEMNGFISAGMFVVPFQALNTILQMTTIVALMLTARLMAPNLFRPFVGTHQVLEAA
jgi:hypothetical protein